MLFYVITAASWNIQGKKRVVFKINVWLLHQENGKASVGAWKEPGKNGGRVWGKGDFLQ